MKNKMKMRVISLLLCFVMLLSLMPISALAVTEIHQANITITKPVGGENPDISPVSSESDKYYADVDTWVWMYGGSGTPVGAGGTFNTHELYALRVIFRAKPGYTLADDCVYTINGETTGCYSMDGNEFRYVYLYAADPQKPTYTVSFDADGGTGTMADVTDVFADYKLPACTFTAPAGKFFTGWFVGGYMKDPGVSILVFKDTNVLACWKNIPAPGSGYSVTYNGGAECGGSMAAQNKTDFYGELTLPECGFTPPAGKRFACWQEGNNKWNPGDKIIVSFNTTVDAIWEDIPQQLTTYTVNFDANGGTGTMASANKVSGNYTLPPNGFTPPANKQFKCWSVNGNEKNPFESISVTANVTVKAIWKDIETTSYTVSFNSNGGSGSMASVTNAPSLYTLPANGFTPPANKQFKCWAVGAQNDEYDPGDKINITANTTVKALWKNITSSRQVISHVEANSSDLNNILTLYGLLKIPTFNITQGAPAYINASTSNLVWQKKIGGVWTNQASGRFTPGEWRISSSLRIDGTNGYYYELGNPTTLTVNGQAWIVENDGKPSVHPDYSHANIVSPAFTIVDDPNVQPPVPVESVNMVLNGYTPGAAAASATVTTDANVEVTILGFIKGIDSNGDGQPDALEPVTGNFASGEMYAVSLKINAKSGYDISGLSAQNVSLDRAILDVFEENVISDESFNGLYMLGDAMQYTVTFETNGGSAIQPVTVGGGGTVAEPAAPTKAYFAFAGWYSDSNLTQVFDFNTPITGNITLYAKWTPSPVGGMFLMTIDLNGGTNTTSSPLTGEVSANETMYFTDNLNGFIIPPSGKVLAGYEIDGVPYDPGTGHLVTQNFTLKLLWKDAPVTTYTVTFEANGGTGTMADVTGVSGEYTLPENGFTAPDGKQFKAWSVDGNEKAVGDKITVTANTIVNAVWETIPAGHTCNIKPVAKNEPSCTEGGKEAYYKCEGCGKFYEDALGAKEITDLAAWGNINKNGHKDDNNDGKCDVCRSDMGTGTGNNSGVQSPQTGENSIMWLWFALLFVCGAGAFGIFFIVRKMKATK